MTKLERWARIFSNLNGSNSLGFVRLINLNLTRSSIRRLKRKWNTFSFLTHITLPSHKLHLFQGVSDFFLSSSGTPAWYDAAYLHWWHELGTGGSLNFSHFWHSVINQTIGVIWKRSRTCNLSNIGPRVTVARDDWVTWGSLSWRLWPSQPLWPWWHVSTVGTVCKIGVPQPPPLHLEGYRLPPGSKDEDRGLPQTILVSPIKARRPWRKDKERSWPVATVESSDTK